MTVQARPCTACHQPVFDLDHVRTRNTAPIDAKPDASGNIVIHLEDGYYTILRKEVLAALTDDERAKLHNSHFATCRYANRFRREVRNATDRRFMA